MLLATPDIADGFVQFVRRFVSGLYNPWAVAVELLLVGSVIYLILNFLQGTRGERVFRAVLMILTISFLLVQVVAQQFELHRINFLYPYFLQAVFLGSLIAFQHELRRLLIRLGETFWFGQWSKNSERLIDPLVTAVTKLSSSKIGALIALERGTRLGSVADSGVPLDAAVTAELIETIFWPGAPLHDLGVIIRQGRVVAAGCQFPLAESDGVDRALGSRHRAAIGMSQEADTVVLVVSEETGIISLALDGRLQRGFTPAELRSTLVSVLLKGKPPREERPSQAPGSSTAAPSAPESPRSESPQDHDESNQAA